jgi:hypothetical protein
MEPSPVKLTTEGDPGKMVKSAITNKTSGAADAMPVVELDWQAQVHSLACKAPPVW